MKSFPVHLDDVIMHGGNVDVAHDAEVSHGIRAAMGCQRSPAVTRGGPHGRMGDAAPTRTQDGWIAEDCDLGLVPRQGTTDRR